MATHSSILTWEIPCIEEPGYLQSMGCKESDKTQPLYNKNDETLGDLFFFFSQLYEKSSKAEKKSRVYTQMPPTQTEPLFC